MHDVRKEAARHELVCSKIGSAVRALRSGFFDPLAKAVVATHFGAVWAHHCILDGAITNEAVEKFFKLDLLLRTSSVRDLNRSP